MKSPLMTTDNFLIKMDGLSSTPPPAARDCRRLTFSQQSAPEYGAIRGYQRLRDNPSQPSTQTSRSTISPSAMKSNAIPACLPRGGGFRVLLRVSIRARHIHPRRRVRSGRRRKGPQAAIYARRGTVNICKPVPVSEDPLAVDEAVVPVALRPPRRPVGSVRRNRGRSLVSRRRRRAAP